MKLNPRISVYNLAIWSFGLFAVVIGALVLFPQLTKSKETSREPIGRIIDTSVVATSFNESSKTQVKAEKLHFVILGHPQIPIGEYAEIVVFGGSRSYLVVSGANHLLLR